MIKEIVTDPIFLKQKSTPAARSDQQTIRDLLDTVLANSEHCAGMAANMIGVTKTILAAQIGSEYLIMVNPKITDHSKQCYNAEESCLSLSGRRTAKRYNVITVEYLDKKFKRRKQTFRDFEAQVIQHEMDHFDGILI